jgi:hypothetical protein
MKKQINYIDILNKIKTKNVELRHDVDICLDSAWRMAKIEKQNNVKSIFYVRFDCDYYNPMSLKNKQYIEYIVENHELGCHVDATNLENENDLLEYLNSCNNIIPFDKFTFHINTEKTKSFGNLETYQNKSLLTAGYISDSRNIFTEEDYNSIIELDDYTLLIHPEWWDNNDFVFGEDTGEEKISKSLILQNLLSACLQEILP